MHPACAEPMRMPPGEFQGESRVWENRTHGSVGEVKLSRRQATGFTLVELLVVIAIISVLAGLLLPALEEARDAAQSIHCLNNLHQVALVVTAYQDDFAPMVLAAYPYKPRTDSSGNNKEMSWDRQLVKHGYIPFERDAIQDSPHFGDTWKQYKNNSRWFSGILRCPLTKGDGWLYHEAGSGYGMITSLGDGGKWYRTHEGCFPLSELKNPGGTVHIADAYHSGSSSLPEAWVPASYDITDWHGPSEVSMEGNTIMSPFFGNYRRGDKSVDRFAHRHQQGTNCLFYDGHVERVATYDLDYTPAGTADCLVDNR